MRRSRRRGRIGGLRAQLLLGLVGLLVLTLALVALATLQLHSRHLQRTVAEEAQRHARWLAELDGSDEQQSALEALRAQDQILYAGAATEELAGQLETSSRVWIADHDGRAAVWAVEDATTSPLVVLSLQEAQAAADAGRSAVLLYLGLTLLFVTLVGYAFFSFIVIRPLRALGVATERASRGDLASPVAVIPRNEFGDVAREFNTMLETLDDQRAELQEQLQKLEQAHRELKQTQDTLIRSEKMASVGHLAAGVAHEVGNPLAAVMGYTELLCDRSLDQATADDIAERTLVQLKRIQQIIRQLLDYSRTDSDREPSALAIDDVIDEAVHLVRATPEGKKVDIAVELADDLPSVQAIAGEIEQVLVNLLLNAVRAMDDAGSDPAHLHIEAGIDQDMVRVDIRDSGPGIEPDVANRIFEPFFTTSDPGEGTGLGLAIAQRLISRADGNLELISGDDGAHFRIELPIQWSRTS